MLPSVSIHVLASMATIVIVGIRYARLKVGILHIKMITNSGKLSLSTHTECPFLLLLGTLANSFNFFVLFPYLEYFLYNFKA